MTFPFIIVAVNGLGPPSPPVNVTPPSISAVDLTVGAEAEGEVGTYSPAASSYQRQWYRDSAGDAIAGATGADYIFTEDDVNRDIIFGVVPINAGGTGAEAFSAPVGPILPGLPGLPVNTVAPVISGTPLIGQTLSGTDGTWLPAASSYVRQWYQDSAGDPIAGATGSTYVALSGDSGHDILFGVKGVNASGTGTEAFSAPFGPILPGVPVNTVAPVISGTPEIGQTLSGNDGTWSPAASSYARRWYQDSAGDPISGATASTYVVATADAGYELLFGVKGINISGTGTEAFSAPVGPVGPVPAGIEVTNLGTLEDTGSDSQSNFSYGSFGPAVADRLLIACITCRDDSTVHSVSSATIGGVTATVVADAGGASTTTTAVIISAIVPTGPSGTVVVNWSEAIESDQLCTLLRATGASATPYDSDAVSADASSGSISGTIDYPAGGLVVGCAANPGGGGNSWTGLSVRDNDSPSTDGDIQNTVGHEVKGAGATGATITCNFGGFTDRRALALASFEPA